MASCLPNFAVGLTQRSPPSKPIVQISRSRKIEEDQAREHGEINKDRGNIEEDRGRSRKDRGRIEEDLGRSRMIEEITFSVVNCFLAIFVTLEFLRNVLADGCADGLRLGPFAFRG